MSFSNIFDSSLIDYSSDFEQSDKKYIDNIKSEWYELIESKFNYEANLICKDETGYFIKEPWEALYDYGVNTNGEKFVNLGHTKDTITFFIPQYDKFKKYLGTLELIIYVSKPNIQPIRIYNSKNNVYHVEYKIVGDPNTYFKYKLIDIRTGYIEVSDGEVHHNIEEIANQLDNLNDQYKYKHNILRKLYYQIKGISIRDTIDYILEKY